MSLRRILPPLLLAALGGTAAAGRAFALGDPDDREPLHVRTNGGAWCFTDEQLWLELEGRTSRVRRATDSEAARTLVVELLAQDSAVTGSLVLEENGTRTEPRVIHAASCEEALSAVALIAALSVDPNARTAPLRRALVATTDGGIADGSARAGAPATLAVLADAGPPLGIDAAVTRETIDAGTPANAVARPAAEDRAPARPAPGPNVTPEPANAPEAPAPLNRWLFTVGGGVEAVAPEGLGHPFAFAPRVYLEAEKNVPGILVPSVRLSADRTAAAALSTAGYSASPVFYTAEVTTCPVRTPGHLLAACAEVQAGAVAMQAQGTGAKPETRPWVAPGLSALIAWPGVRLASRLELVLDAEVGVRIPVVRETFYFTENGSTLNLPTWPYAIAHADLTAGVRFW